MKTWQHIYVAFEHALENCLCTILTPQIISGKSQKLCLDFSFCQIWVNLVFTEIPMKAS